MNVSEGRDQAALRAIAERCAASLVDVHTDADHNRSVFTLAGPGPHDASGTARRLAGAVAGTLSIAGHDGVHPYLGALDVVPFVALGGTKVEQRQAADAARAFGKWWADTHAVPVFFYDDADPEGRDLPYLRRHTFPFACTGLRSGRAPPDPGRDRRRRAQAVGRGQPAARDHRHRRRSADRARGPANPTAGCPGCARSG